MIYPFFVDREKLSNPHVTGKAPSVDVHQGVFTAWSTLVHKKLASYLLLDQYCFHDISKKKQRIQVAIQSVEDAKSTHLTSFNHICRVCFPSYSGKP